MNLNTINGDNNYDDPIIIRTLVPKILLNILFDPSLVQFINKKYRMVKIEEKRQAYNLSFTILEINFNTTDFVIPIIIILSKILNGKIINTNYKFFQNLYLKNIHYDYKSSIFIPKKFYYGHSFTNKQFEKLIKERKISIISLPDCDEVLVNINKIHFNEFFNIIKSNLNLYKNCYNNNNNNNNDNNNKKEFKYFNKINTEELVYNKISRKYQDCQSIMSKYSAVRHIIEYRSCCYLNFITSNNDLGHDLNSNQIYLEIIGPYDYNVNFAEQLLDKYIDKIRTRRETDFAADTKNQDISI
ncbi:hypothetical protein PACTADRAFT_74804 [Pachysolen tannophilus NRRL Y-2460]|uniref:Uncharacterized protein n=1 Tax=Pachysolen tannophilus NRRL Y-2460 TaxID=669874 RepID=A0A1E4TZU4_PACTA|nr:hypothetical protein PACTADRAFT_74804 [Pachysolen tannophilus NRRL Y-2460]